MRRGLRRLARRVTATVLLHSRALHALRGGADRRPFILGYHRVLVEGSPQSSFVQPGMYVTEGTFEMHVRYLLAHYKVVPLEELISMNDKDACAITFDDGWRDNYEAAYPILRAHRVPATIFLATSLIGTTRWPWPDRICFYIHHAAPMTFSQALRSAWRSETGEGLDLAIQEADPFDAAEDVLRHLKSLEHGLLERVVCRIDADFKGLETKLQEWRPWLTWEEAAEMSRHGISFGSHTENHVILTSVPLPVARAEIENSRGRISAVLGRPVTAFCYPNGAHNTETVRIVAETGYQCAVTTESGRLDKSASPFELTRILLHDDISSTRAMLACTLAGWRGFRSPHRPM